VKTKKGKSRKVQAQSEPNEPRSGWYVAFNGAKKTLKDKDYSMVLAAGPFPTRENAVKKIEDLDEFAVYVGTKV
jgi:hypothetical protein